MDKEREMEVWNRVYPGMQRPACLTQRQKQMLRFALRRCMENQRIYESMTCHGRYGEAFARMASDNAEQIKMLRQILGQ